MSLTNKTYFRRMMKKEIKESAKEVIDITGVVNNPKDVIVVRFIDGKIASSSYDEYRTMLCLLYSRGFTKVAEEILTDEHDNKVMFHVYRREE